MHSLIANQAVKKGGSTFCSSIGTVLSGKMLVFITCFQLVETIHCCALTGGYDSSMAEPRALHGDTATSIPVEVWGKVLGEVLGRFCLPVTCRIQETGKHTGLLVQAFFSPYKIWCEQ